MPKSDDENSISNVGGEYIDYYCVYFAKSAFASDLYMQYENYLDEWMTRQYPDANKCVKYGFTSTSYQRAEIVIRCTKYTIETPHNIMKLHI